MSELVPVKTRYANVTKLIESMHNAIEKSLPRSIGVDRFAQVALTAFQKNPALLNCEPATIYGAVLQAARLGLEIDCVGQAWLVPFGKNCQLLIGYQGLTQLVHNSGLVSSIQARIVYDNDEFDYWETHDGAHLKHVPYFMRPEETKPGKRILAYAITTMKDGRRVIEVVPEFKIKQHQASSRAGASSPWKTHEDEMWLKTAVRIACRLLPKSTALAQAVHLDTQVEAGIDQDLGRGMVVDAELLSAGVEEDAKAPETAEGGAQEQKPAARKARPKEKAVAEPAQPEADKATAKAAEPEKVTPDQVKALFTLAAQIHGAEGREAVREVMRIHGYKIAAHIPGSEWATVEREVRAWKAPGGSALDAPAGSDREDGDPGPEEELPF